LRHPHPEGPLLGSQKCPGVRPHLAGQEDALLPEALTRREPPSNGESNEGAGTQDDGCGGTQSGEADG
jgi:hypothetical protein